jgi:hypothetical protein
MSSSNINDLSASNNPKELMAKKNKLIPVLKRGVITEEPDDIDKVRYEFVSPNQFFGNTLNLLPMQNSVTAARAFYEHKFITQALPIKDGESPNVQSLKNADNNESYEDYLGKKTGVISLDEDDNSADILEVTPDYIKYKNDKGETKTKNLYNNFAFNRKTMLTNYPLVKAGDKISRDKSKNPPILAKTNFTDNNGTLNMGLNARVGFVPYKGWSMDDAVVISEDFAKKMTSQHMYQYSEANDSKDIKTGKDHFKAFYPDKFSKEQMDKIDDNGVIKVGAVVNPGDPLIVSTRSRVVSSNDANLGRLSKYLKTTRLDSSQVWDHNTPGIVTDVVKTNDGYKVNVETFAPMQEGDKMCYHPDTEVFTEDGWKNITDIKLGDKVVALTTDLSGKPSGYKLSDVIEIHKYKLNNDTLYGYEDEHVAQLVTGNHNCAINCLDKLTYETANLLSYSSKDEQFISVSPDFDLNNGNDLKYTFINKNNVYKAHDYSGEVIGIGVNAFSHIILTRYHNKPIFSGNSTRSGNKLTVSHILPQNEMPRTKDGKPLDVLFNQLGLVSRVNANMMYEAMLGKVAEKTGKKYKLPTFNKDSEKWYDFVENELKKNNLSDVEPVYDPVIDRDLDQPIAVGNAYFLKLHHTSDSKLSSRGQGIYDQNEMPVKGGETGMMAKRQSSLENNGLLSSGAYNVIKDALHLRGQRNDDYWRKVRMGQTPSLAKKSPFIWDKYIALMQGAGINAKRADNGDSIQATPFTDKDFALFNPVEIKNDGIIDFKNMKPISGGLFDPALTVGNRWGKITLDRPYPNPAFEDTIISLLGLKRSTFNDILAGKESLLKYGTGTQAIYNALSDIDIDKDLEQAKQDFKYGPKSKKQQALNRIMALDGLKNNRMKPEEFMITKVPVIPPKFRPYSIMGKDTFLPGDANELYQDVINMAHTQGEILQELGPDEANKNVPNVYKSLKALYGYGEPASRKLKQRGVSGFLQKLIGGTSKFSQWNRNVISKPVDFSARGVIDANPEISMDELGIPYEMGFEIYSPYIQRELVKRGLSPKDALQNIKDQTKMAKDALQAVVDGGRWITASRAPAWFKMGVLGFKPVFHEGKNILLPPVVSSGLGADFDGDCQWGHVFVCVRDS